MPRYPDTDSLLAAVESLLPVVIDEAAAAAAERRLTAPLVEALLERQLFRLFVPQAIGGEEADLPIALEVFERVSRADGAAGWCVMIGAGAGLFAGFLEPDAARTIFGDERAVVAGSGAATGTARRDSDGYRVSGRWAYASGAHHASWFTANCVFEDGQIRSVAVPADDVRIVDTWDVAAMCGTGSDDIEIVDAFVPDAFIFLATDGKPVASGPLYRVPFFTVAELSFAAVSLGIARHALESFADLARTKPLPGAGAMLATDPDVQSRYARAEAIVGSARAFLYDLAQAAWECVVRGDTVSSAAAARLRLAALDAVHGSAVAVDLLQVRAGMTALGVDSEFARAWRDAHAVTQNVVVSAGLYADAGCALLDGRS
jgi:alkylation response protein AidB-like acyl-CoA dehydrogenase